MGVIVASDYTVWQTLFPEFANVSEDQYGLYFDLATQFCRNDGGGPVSKESIQTRLLNLMTAHWAQLLTGTATSDGPSPLVGAIQSASEGSVSVSVKNDYPQGTPQWYQQTKYGSAFWAATAPYRQMRYIRGAPNLGAVVGPGGGIGGNFWNF